MAKRDNDDTLDKSSRKRLEDLGKQWEKPVSGSLFNNDALTLPDLRLLLEHYQPLQDLIRNLIAVPAGVAPAAVAQQITILRERLAEEEDKCRIASADFSRIQSELSKAQARCRALQSDLVECNTATQQLLQAKDKLEKQLQLAQKDLSVCRTELDHFGNAPAELTLLRGDAELAQRLELIDLSDDNTRALIQIVAVLSQSANIERLWQALKERSEAKNRPANEAERGLLKSALVWHNYNWRTHPYRLIETTPHTPYDFDRHLRSQQTPTGEKISEQRLPGIADGSGKLLCKVLVSTT